MYRKKPMLYVIAIAIAGLMIAVTSSTAIQLQTSEGKTFFVNNNPKIQIAKMDIAPLKGKIQLSIQTKEKSAIPIFAGFHPTVASDTLGNVVMGFDEDQTPNVWFTASNDNGQNWVGDAAGWDISPAPTLPDVDSCGDGRFMGTMVPNFMAGDGGDLYKVQITDPMAVPDGYTCNYWTFGDLGDGYTNFDSVSAAGYTATDAAENTWAFGASAIVGDLGGTAPVINTNFFSYQMTSDGYAWIYQWTGIAGSTAATNDIDSSNLYSYAAWNYDNGGNLDVYVSVMDFGTWDEYAGYPIHPDVKDLSIETAGNDNNIDISALNDNVIVVSERDGNIYAYYSMDGMSSAEESFIDTGACPRIVHYGTDKAVCTFVKNEQVYLSKTENGGVSWSTPELIDEPENNNVPDEDRAIDVCGVGASWMNTDDGNVYFASISTGAGTAPAIPTITGDTKIKPNKDTEYTFVTTDPDGDQVYYYIEWGDGSTLDWQGPYASGTPFTASHSWADKAAFTIKCKAKDTNDMQSGFGTLDISTPRNIRFLDYFQHLFPNLWEILGL
jgi:hypothetical protein